jgi:hypothetical protein
MRIISERLDVRSAVDNAALDKLQIMLIRPLETLLEAPITAVECVRVKADPCHHFASSVF